MWDEGSPKNRTTPLKILRTFIIIAVLYAVQIALMDLIAIRGYRPDLILIYMFLCLPGKGNYKPLLAGFGLGLAQDLMGGGIVGVNALAKSLSGFLLGKFFPNKPLEAKWFCWVGAAICIILHDFTYHYVYGQGEYQSLFDFLFRRVIPTSAYNISILFLLTIIPRKRRMVD